MKVWLLFAALQVPVILLFGESPDIPGESGSEASRLPYRIADTNQTAFFNNSGEIQRPELEEPFYGQDAHFPGNRPDYRSLSDERIQDKVTGLIWQKGYRVMTLKEAQKELERLNKSDPGWRIPSIKEAYSLIDFSGVDPSGPPPFRMADAHPFIDDGVFDFQYSANGPRPIDAQMLTSTIYRGRTMGHNDTVFGVNFADGRIKGYPIKHPRGEMRFMVRFVRGNPAYGKNIFNDNGDGTITDSATGLMWAQADSGKGMNWPNALDYAKKMNKQKYLGYTDWRVPDAKELHSIVDYSRSPQKDNSPALNPIFKINKIIGEDGKERWPYFWTSTTHRSIRGGQSAVYFAFGEALGYFSPPHSGRAPQLMDVHGAGAQRSDPKIGDPADYPRGRGPQGDVIRINNYVRLVRSAP
ncbi:MAG TPA: DUF1566 domain-containing protein [Leptospiraceae bacterium]|nr:hypothetical protein [Spirochaetaceae bacterium]HBS03667.1 DUF1566 domain-containing protein [Leptospiraceae bacterium]|tara:strand:- start:7667 stop:8902 length:1236 start_codon:yes stop_codon:yes gene_type:complete